jgi:hypothetical protein
VITTADSADVIAASGGQWHALAVRGSTGYLRLPPGGTARTNAQVITVPIRYGSSS